MNWEMDNRHVKYQIFDQNSLVMEIFAMKNGH